MKLRDEIPEEIREEKNRKIADALFSLPAFRKAETIFTYVSWKSEADTWRILEEAWRLGKKTAVPKVLHTNGEREMAFYEITAFSQLHPGMWKIPEPEGKEDKRRVPGRKDLIIFPGTVFDEERHRIGYGGGYYDRYLEKTGSILSAAIAFEEQIVSSVPWESHDIRPDQIITDCRIIY